MGEKSVKKRIKSVKIKTKLYSVTVRDDEGDIDDIEDKALNLIDRAEKSLELTDEQSTGVH